MADARKDSQSPTKNSVGSPTTTKGGNCKGKVVIIGEFSVGKTCLSHRFIAKTFAGTSEPTIGAAFQVRTIPISPQTSVTLEIWDTAGSERYRSLMPMYYRDASAAVICYDITNAKSFERASVWLGDFRRHNENSASQVCIVLAGTKHDLSEKREVQAAEAKEFSDREGLHFFETSAKTDHCVADVFVLIAEHIAKIRETQTADKITRNNMVVGAGRGNSGRVALHDNEDEFDFYNRRKRKQDAAPKSTCQKC